MGSHLHSASFCCHKHRPCLVIVLIAIAFRIELSGDFDKVFCVSRLRPVSHCKEGMPSVNADSFHRGPSQEAGTGSRVLRGRASAEERATPCRAQEWVLFNTVVPSSQVPDGKHY